MKITHDTLMKLMKAFGYNKNADGVCNGFIWMWIQAQLLGDEGAWQFYKRLKVIETYQSDFTKLIEKIAEIRQEILRNADNPYISLKLFTEHRALLEIQSFCEGIEIYHNPELHTDLFNDKDPHDQENPKVEQPLTPGKIHHQQDNLKLLSPMAVSDELLEMAQELKIPSPVNALVNACFIFTPQECVSYFTELQKWFDLNKEYFGHQITIPIKMGAEHHAIACSYNLSSRKWQFIDINDDEEELYTTDISSIEELVENIQWSFDDEDYILFHVIPIAINPDLIPVSVLNELKLMNKKHQNLSKIRTERTNSRLASLQYMASKIGDVDTIGEMVNLGANINVIKENGSSPLCVACQNKEFEVAQLLVKNGASVNHVKKNGDTPLHMATFSGDLDLVSLLCTHGAKINLPNKSGYTPLLIALQHGHDLVVEYLLQNGADPYQPNLEGITPLEVALKSGNLKSIQHLMKFGVSINGNLSTGYTPLTFAIMNSSIDLSLWLLNNGANPDRTDNKGITPLYWASMLGLKSVMNSILEKSTATLNVPCETGHTPLLVACFSYVTANDPEVFQILLHYGADVEQRNDDGMFALDIALLKEEKNMAAVKAIMSYLGTKDINYKNKLSSVTLGNSEIMDLLNQVVIEMERLKSVYKMGMFKSSENLAKSSGTTQHLFNV